MFLALKNCGIQKVKRIIKVILSYIPKAFILPGIISLNSKQNQFSSIVLLEKLLMQLKDINS